MQVTDVSATLAQGSPPEKEGRMRQCLECDRAFSSAAVLLHHSREVHGKERIHGCPVCRKAFKRATHLKVRPWPPCSVQLSVRGSAVAGPGQCMGSGHLLTRRSAPVSGELE